MQDTIFVIILPAYDLAPSDAMPTEATTLIITLGIFFLSSVAFVFRMTLFKMGKMIAQNLAASCSKIFSIVDI